MHEIYGMRQSDLCTSKCNIATCCFDTPIDMILLHPLLTARRELSSFSLTLFLPLPRFPIFCYLYTKPSRVVAVYGNSGGGSSGSRKSQINPFVIPHRSFQPVRISSTRFYATSAPSRNSSPFSSAPSCYPVKRGLFYRLHLHIFSSLPVSHYPIFAIFPSYLSFSYLYYICASFLILFFFLSSLLSYSHISFILSNFICSSFSL